ncbi:MAG: hypothetical protein ACLFUT_13410, partial [Desulfobacteraceae bacterium]
DAWVYDPDANTCTQVPAGGDVPSERTEGAGAFWQQTGPARSLGAGEEDTLWVMGGDAGGTLLQDFYQYTNGTWTQKPDLPVALGKAAGAVFEQDGRVKILLFGGVDGDWNESGRTFVYTTDMSGQTDSDGDGVSDEEESGGMTIYPPTAPSWIRGDRHRFRHTLNPSPP